LLGDGRALGELEHVVDAYPRATLLFYTVVGRQWLSFLRDSHTNLAVVAVIFSQNGSVTPGC
jgi:hypothetical protein